VPETPAAPLESLVLRGCGCRRQPINGASSPSEAFLSVLRENLGRGSGGFFPEKLGNPPLKIGLPEIPGKLF
jgi:hypothetical protein